MTCKTMEHASAVQINDETAVSDVNAGSSWIAYIPLSWAASDTRARMRARAPVSHEHRVLGSTSTATRTFVRREFCSQSVLQECPSRLIPYCILLGLDIPQAALIMQRWTSSNVKPGSRALCHLVHHGMLKDGTAAVLAMFLWVGTVQPLELHTLDLEMYQLTTQEIYVAMTATFVPESA